MLLFLLIEPGILFSFRPEHVQLATDSFHRTCTCRVRSGTHISGREGQPKEPHVPRGDSGKDPPPVKQKPRSRGIEVRDRWEGGPSIQKGPPAKGRCCCCCCCCCCRVVVVADNGRQAEKMQQSIDAEKARRGDRVGRRETESEREREREKEREREREGEREKERKRERRRDTK